MFRRGFQTSSEETSLKIGVNWACPHRPLSPPAIAQLLRIPILAPDQLPELPGEAGQRLQRDHSEAWSAMTVSDGKNHLIVMDPNHCPHEPIAV